MKTIITLSLLWAGFCSWAQTNFYTAHKSTAAYDTLQGSTRITSTINPGNAYYFEMKQQWMLFDEQLDNDTLTAVRNGQINSAGPAFRTSLAPCLANLEFKNDPQSGIFVSETPQKLSVEWRNITLSGQPSGSYLNFMINIYGNQVFEFHYGPSDLNTNNAFGGSGPTVYAVIYTLDFQQTLEIHSVGGDPSNPSFFSVTGQTHKVNAFPDSGTVYRFEPYNLSLPDKNKNHQLSFFPNPVKNVLHITDKSVKNAVLYGPAGNEVKRLQFENGKVNISEVAPGIYFLSVTTNEGLMTTTTIIKQE